MLKAKTAHIQGVKLSTAVVIMMAPGVHRVRTICGQVNALLSPRSGQTPFEMPKDCSAAQSLAGTEMCFLNLTFN